MYTPGGNTDRDVTDMLGEPGSVLIPPGLPRSLAPVVILLILPGLRQIHLSVWIQDSLVADCEMCPGGLAAKEWQLWQIKIAM